MIAPVLPTYKRTPFAFERGEGAQLFTTTGQEYLDFGGGIAVASLGHCHPALVEALQNQAAKLWHTSNVYEIPGQERLARRLTDASFADTVFFTNSGAEALESVRITEGKFVDEGEVFTRLDDWRDQAVAYFDMGRAWIGSTRFLLRKVERP